MCNNNKNKSCDLSRTNLNDVFHTAKPLDSECWYAIFDVFFHLSPTCENCNFPGIKMQPLQHCIHIQHAIFFNFGVRSIAFSLPDSFIFGGNN